MLPALLSTSDDSAARHYGAVDRAAPPRARSIASSRAVALGAAVLAGALVATATRQRWREAPATSFKFQDSDDNDTACVGSGSGGADLAYVVQQFMGYPAAIDPAGGVIFSDRGQFSMWHLHNMTYDPVTWGKKLSANFDRLLRSVIQGSYCKTSFLDMASCDGNCEMCTGSSSLPYCEAGQTDTVEANVSCVEKCVQDRYDASVLANSAFPTLQGCSDPIAVAFLYAPQLIKSCFDATFDCATATPPCESGCYDCITDCIETSDDAGTFSACNSASL